MYKLMGNYIIKLFFTTSISERILAFISEKDEILDKQIQIL